MTANNGDGLEAFPRSYYFRWCLVVALGQDGLFQNRIISMHGFPRNARRGTIANYRNQCGGIEWREEKKKSGDGAQMSLCVASVNCNVEPSTTVYILYFQGLSPVSLSWVV